MDRAGEPPDSFGVARRQYWCLWLDTPRAILPSSTTSDGVRP